MRTARRMSLGLALLWGAAGCGEEAGGATVVALDAAERQLGDLGGGGGAGGGGATDAGATLDGGAVDQGAGATDGSPDAQAGTDLGPTADAEPEEDAFIDPRPVACQAPSMGGPPLALDLASRCRAPGGPLRVRDLRDARCPDHRPLPARLPGRAVVLDEAVVTGVFGTDFSVQDPEGGAYAGLYVYNPDGARVDGLAPGARVRLAGQVFEYFTLTELVIAADGLTRLGPGAAPAPVILDEPARIATGGPLAEALESLLVEVRSVRVVDTAPDCPRDFGMFVLEGGLRVEARGFVEPARGDHLERATGVLHFSFEHTKLRPRAVADLDMEACGGTPDKCEATPCSVTPETPERGGLILTELQIDPLGEDDLREFVEIYNPGPRPVDLAGHRLEDCGGNGVTLQGTLAARAFHVVARSQDRATNGGVVAQGTMGDLFLPNGRGAVLLFDAEGRLLDQVRYDSVAPWPGREPGRSLELMEPAAANDEGPAWSVARRRYGEGGFGSPGEAWRP